MLVLWDSTYVSRLWCIFELAAFLRNNQQATSGSYIGGSDSALNVPQGRHGSRGAHDCLLVRPVTLGPCTLGVYLTAMSLGVTHLIPHTIWWMRLCFQVVPAFFSIHVFRNYTCSVHTLAQELETFSMKQTKCGCCAVNHVHPETGAKILCDRHVVEACVRSWFGKISSFEKYVRSTFDVNLRQQLGIQYAFPYSWALCALSPVLWAEMDVIAAVSHTGSYERITARLLLGFFAMYLEIFPFMIACVCRFATLFKRKCTSFTLDLLVSLGGAFAMMLLIAGVLALHRLLLQVFDSCILVELCFFLINLVLTSIIWWPSFAYNA